MPSFVISSRADLTMPRLSSRRVMSPSSPGIRRSRPRYMFEAMSSAGATASVWYTVSIPACLLSSGLLNSTRLPSSSSSPRSG